MEKIEAAKRRFAIKIRDVVSFEKVFNILSGAIQTETRYPMKSILYIHWNVSTQTDNTLEILKKLKEEGLVVYWTNDSSI